MIGLYLIKICSLCRIHSDLTVAVSGYQNLNSAPAASFNPLHRNY